MKNSTLTLVIFGFLIWSISETSEKNIWDNCLRFAQQLLSWLKMNVLNKALFATKLFTLFCVMCIRMLLLTEIEANRQTIRNNSASIIGAMHWQIMRCSFSNRCIPTNHYMEEIWRSSSFVCLHDISNKASLILEDKLDLFTPGVEQPWIG